MLGKFILGAAASLSALTLLPGAAQADHRDGYYGDRYDGRYYDSRSRRGYYGDRYDDGRYRRYRRGDDYGRGYDGYGYGRGYDRYGYGDRYYRGRRCGSGTTGAIIGGAAGALVGREISRDGRRFRRRGGSGTTGAIIGGAIGALVGREISRSC